MILTTKGRYAVMALLEMAGSNAGTTINLLHISESQNIPHSYLEQLFAKLKRESIVTSIRGPGGGYKLNNRPEDISIYQIISAVEGDISVPRCGEDKKCGTHAVKCTAHYLLEGLENHVINYLSKISLADVRNGNVIRITDPEPVRKIYLDYNATTPINPYVKEEIFNLLGPAQNPSSLHWHGRKAKALIENARNKIAAALGIKLGVGEYQVTFTSSGTEANNLLLHNFAGKDILISNIEHLSILDGAKEYGSRILIEVDSDGQIDMKQLLECFKKAPAGSLVSVIMANNETGIIQENMQAITKLAHEYGLFMHSDCVQAFCKVPMDVTDLDFITISAHKIGGALGAAALIHRTNFHIKAQLIGGGQERGVRSGTENVPAIIGFGKATELTRNYEKIEALRDKMEDMIRDICPDAVFYGKNTSRLPNTSMIMMPGIDAHKQLIQFDLHDISVSAGSACSSGKMKTSHVLVAMGVPEKEAQCAIRVSLGVDTKLEQIEKFVEIWKMIKNNIATHVIPAAARDDMGIYKTT